MKKFNKYQLKIANIADYPDSEPAGLISALWLGEEALEVIKEYKRALKDETELDLEAVKEEIGDTLVCLANLCSDLGLSLKEIANDSFDKLSQRMDEEESE